MPSTKKRTLTLPLHEFDRQLIPASVRGGKPALRHDAMSTVLRQQFRKLGGTIQKIQYSPTEVEVTWLQDLDAGDPIHPLVAMLQRGEHAEALLLLKLLLNDDPDDTAILYNLGMASSDQGALPEAIGYLRRLVELDPRHVNGRVALGVALMRKGDRDGALTELELAVQVEPSNPWARRNLGGALMKVGRNQEAVEHLREATISNPADQQAWYGLGHALELAGDDAAADNAYARALEINEFGDVAEQAREGRTRISHREMRDRAGGGARMDAVMYIFSALRKFDSMTPEQVREIGGEIAFLGRRGLDINDPTPKYTLRTLPGEFSGMHLVSIMYAAFQQFAPREDVGIDLSREYEMAQGMLMQGGGGAQTA